jgi:iron complex transport system ATP-binding protein
MVNNAAISAIGLTAGYTVHGRKAAVLNNVNFSGKAGDLIGIAGQNGTGKSTLMRTLAGLQPALHGEVLVGGNPLKGMRFDEVAKYASVVLTEKISGFNLTVFDAVSAGQMPYTDAFHRLRPENVKAIETAMQEVGISSFRGKLLHELSDGQFQKTMIARAVAQNTPLMLLDEPTAYLDYASRHQLFLMLQKLCAAGKCVLISSHDLDLLIKYCNRILIAEEGSVRIITSEEAVKDEGFLRIAGGYMQ